MDLSVVAQETESKAMALMDSNDDWKPSKSTDDFTMEMKKSPYFEGNVFRSKATLNAPFDECFKYLHIGAESPRKNWDTDVNRIELYQQIDSDSQLLWSVSNSLAMGLISPRDLLQVVKLKKTDTFMLFTAQSVELDAHPPVDKYIRATTYPWGIRVEKDASDANKCHVTIMVQADLKGRLPKSLIDSSLPSIQASMNKNYIKHLKKIGLLKK